MKFINVLIKVLKPEETSMANMIGASFTLVLLKRIPKEQHKHRMLSFQTKNKKLKRLIDLKIKNSNIKTRRVFLDTTKSFEKVLDERLIFKLK